MELCIDGETIEEVRQKLDANRSKQLLTKAGVVVLIRTPMHGEQLFITGKTSEGTRLLDVGGHPRRKWIDALVKNPPSGRYLVMIVSEKGLPTILK